MYVDDQPFNFIVVGSFLERMHHLDYETYSCPQTALSVFGNSLQKKCCNVGYPLVITDISMPVLSGFDLAKKMLKLQQKKEAWLGVTESKFTIMALLAHVYDGVRMQALDIGMKEVIDKPLEYHSFAVLMTRYFTNIV